jgi:hypothetical protein
LILPKNDRRFCLVDVLDGELVVEEGSESMVGKGFFFGVEGGVALGFSSAGLLAAGAGAGVWVEAGGAAGVLVGFSSDVVAALGAAGVGAAARTTGSTFDLSDLTSAEALGLSDAFGLSFALSSSEEEEDDDDDDEEESVDFFFFITGASETCHRRFKL